MDEKSKLLVNELRQKLGANLESSYDWDFNLLRWLTAYDNNIEQIAPILTSALEFRRNLNLNQLSVDDVDYRSRFNQAMQNNYPGGISGFDKRGNVVIIEPTGRCDPRGLLYICRCSEFIRWRLFETEHVLQLIIDQERKLQKKCGLTMIMDLEGLTSDQIYMPTMNIYISIIVTIQKYYPDMLYKLLVIKAPAVMNVAYRMILPFINKKTRDKLEIISGDLWRSKLLEMIDEDQLPVHWGGKMIGKFDTYGDIRMAGKVPDDDKMGPVYSTPDDLISLTVARGSASRIKFRLESTSTIEWFFSCPYGDIEFGIDKFDISTDQRKNLVPHFRLNTEVVSEFGSMADVEQGDYELVFDNSYSWLRAKAISYRLLIKPIDY